MQLVLLREPPAAYFFDRYPIG